ncbi:hypothetical protein BJV77DRAFT_1009540 [Russula vinacea]|nr:hypothetical protein BJV77DRAFT_1009540 [Russula vinacea]
MLSLLFLCRVIEIIFTLCHHLWTRTRYVRVFLPVIALFPLLDAARRLPPKRAGCATVVEKSSSSSSFSSSAPTSIPDSDQVGSSSTIRRIAL